MRITSQTYDIGRNGIDVLKVLTHAPNKVDGAKNQLMEKPEPSVDRKPIKQNRSTTVSYNPL